MSILTEIRRELERRDLRIANLSYAFDQEKTYLQRERDGRAILAQERRTATVTVTVTVTVEPLSLGQLPRRGLTLMEVCGMDPVMGVPVEATVSSVHSWTAREAGAPLEAQVDFAIVEVPRPAGSRAEVPIHPAKHWID